MIITRTPLRVSLFGGGTDFPAYYNEYDGATLSMAIDKYIYVVAQRRFDDKIRVGYTKTELVSSVHDLQHELIREVLMLLRFPPAGSERGVEINTMADIPSAGSGLGSSAAVISGVIRAVSALQNHTHTRSHLSQLAYVVEHGRLGRPTGLQDQIIVNYGGVRFTTYNGSGFKPMKMLLDATFLRDLEERLLLFFTKLTRSSTDVLSEQQARMTDNLPALEELTVLAYTARSLLEDKGDINAIGELLDESWRLKRSLADQVSNPLIDEVYEMARKYGATGGKICGAGGGGFLLLFCPTEEARKQVRFAMAEFDGWPELPFRIEQQGSRVVFDDGRHQ